MKRHVPAILAGALLGALSLGLLAGAQAQGAPANDPNNVDYDPHPLVAPKEPVSQGSLATARAGDFVVFMKGDQLCRVPVEPFTESGVRCIRVR